MTEPKRILIVDDQEANREGMASLVTSLGYEAETASDGVEALAKMRLGVDLVLLDILMRGMDGFEVARRIRKDPDVKDVPIVMVTALGGRQDRVEALKAGANDFVGKPVDAVELEARIASLLKMKEAQDVLKRHQTRLEEEVSKRTRDLRRTLEEMTSAHRKTNEAHLDTIHRLMVAAEFKDMNTAAHIERIRYYCASLAQGLGLPPGEMELLFHASAMHDVGKIGVPDAILLKPGKLTPEERKVMEEHAEIGGRILNDSPSELLQAGKVIALSHHEKWDGTGYPGGLAGEKIPMWGRICAVADVFDALTSERPYKKAFPNERACEIVRDGRGSHFDPAVTDVFFKQLGEIQAIQRQYGNGVGG